MSTYSTYIDPDKARRMYDLGAFEGRELQVGNFVGVQYYNTGYCKTVALVTKIADKVTSNHRNIYLQGELMSGWYTADECLFLPQEHDLLDALERVMPNKHNMYNWEPYRLRYVIYDGKKEYIVNWGFSDYAYGNTRLEALFNALVSICEARKGGEGKPTI